MNLVAIARLWEKVRSWWRQHVSGGADDSAAATIADDVPDAPEADEPQAS